MTKRELKKKYFKKRTKVTNPNNGFTVIYFEFKPHFFETEAEVEQEGKRLKYAFNQDIFVFKIGKKYTFLPSTFMGEVDGNLFLKTLKEVGIKI